MNYLDLDLRDKSIKELREIGSRLGLKGPTTQSKRELLLNIENHISQSRKQSEQDPELTQFEAVDPERVSTDEKIALLADSERPEIVKGHEAEGIFFPLSGGDGILRVRGFFPDVRDVFVPAGIVNKYGLVIGDALGVRVRAVKGASFEGVFYVATINGVGTDRFTRARFECQPALYTDRRVALGCDDPLVGVMNLVSPVYYGSRVLVSADENVDVTGFAKSILSALKGRGELTAAFLAEKPEEVTAIRGSVACKLVATTCGDDPEKGEVGALLAVESAKRAAEQGRDAIVVVTDISELLSCKRVFAAGRKLEKGSLTVVALTKDQEVAAELAPVANARLTLRAPSVADAPYVDFAESWVGREAELLSKEERKLTRDIRARALQKGSAETTDLIAGKATKVIAELIG